MYYLILKRNARIPSRDTFFARRIEGNKIKYANFYFIHLNKILFFLGPGLASNYFYQVDLDIFNFLLDLFYDYL